MKNVNIMGVHHRGEGGGVTKKTIYRGNCLKRELGQFADNLAKNREEGTFDGGREGVDTPMHTMT